MTRGPLPTLTSLRCRPGHQGGVCHGAPPFPVPRIQTSSSSRFWNTRCEVQGGKIRGELKNEGFSRTELGEHGTHSEAVRPLPSLGKEKVLGKERHRVWSQSAIISGSLTWAILGPEGGRAGTATLDSTTGRWQEGRTQSGDLTAEDRGSLASLPNPQPTLSPP